MNGRRTACSGAMYGSHEIQPDFRTPDGDGLWDAEMLVDDGGARPDAAGEGDADWDAAERHHVISGATTPSLDRIPRQAAGRVNALLGERGKKLAKRNAWPTIKNHHGCICNACYQKKRLFENEKRHSGNEANLPIKCGPL